MSRRSPEGAPFQARRTERRRSRRAARRRAGFTLLEILIASAILTIGLVSIVALFPAAIEVGRQVVNTSNAAVIAQSVAEAVRDSIHNRKRFNLGRGGVSHAYLVFKHDGVTDSVPSDPKFESPKHDYYILLPRYRAGKKFSGATDGDRRFAAVTGREAKTFIYPETDSPPNGNGDAFVAVNDAVSRVTRFDDEDDPDAEGVASELWRRVRKTYHLGLDLIPEAKDEMRRAGKYGDPEDATSERSAVLESLSGRSVLADMKKDVLRQYSYAFAISPSYFDGDAARDRSHEPVNLLYHVRVMVFRRFHPPTEHTKPVPPVFELDFEVSL